MPIPRTTTTTTTTTIPTTTTTPTPTPAPMPILPWKLYKVTTQSMRLEAKLIIIQQTIARLASVPIFNFINATC